MINFFFSILKINVNMINSLLNMFKSSNYFNFNLKNNKISLNLIKFLLFLFFLFFLIILIIKLLIKKI